MHIALFAFKVLICKMSFKSVKRTMHKDENIFTDNYILLLGLATK